MLIDITLKTTPRMVTDAGGNDKYAPAGHVGTHFDVMNKEFPLEYTERPGIIFDVSAVRDRDIDSDDIDLAQVKEDMFVAFHTGFIEEKGYGSKEYFSTHPQLSDCLIDELLKKKISIIGLDCSGVRRGKEHTPKDQYCADHGVFIIENLCNLKAVMEHGAYFLANTYPMNYADMTGLPCRVIAKV